MRGKALIISEEDEDLWSLSLFKNVIPMPVLSLSCLRPIPGLVGEAPGTSFIDLVVAERGGG